MRSKFWVLFGGLILLVYVLAHFLYKPVEVPKGVEKEVIEVKTEENKDEGVMFARTHDVKLNAIDISYDDAQLLLKVGAAEAGNQGIDGIWLVMSVIYNRTLADEFPSTISEVVYQKGAFTTVANGSINRVEVTAECHEALAKLESGVVAPEIVAFEGTRSQTLDRYFTEAFVYKDHRFYTMRR